MLPAFEPVAFAELAKLLLALGVVCLALASAVVVAYGLRR